MSTISRATNNFSENNKLGEGGFGAVYKAILQIRASATENNENTEKRSYSAAAAPSWSIKMRANSNSPEHQQTGRREEGLHCSSFLEDIWGTQANTEMEIKKRVKRAATKAACSIQKQKSFTVVQEISFARDTIRFIQFLKDGDTIVSSGGIFEMGFFSTANSQDLAAWDRADFSGGCVRRTPLSCGNGSSSDGFVKYSGIKLPDTKFSTFYSSLNLQECEQVCFNNCSCIAYSSLDISNGENGCLLWFSDLIDISVVPSDGQDQDLYIKMASSDLDHTSSSNGKKSKRMKLISSSVLIGILVLSLILTLIVILYKRKRKE
nr:G-type lectin S-receptor-like serine/threonine-protein kinase At4g27290 [Ipomoea batatas]